MIAIEENGIWLFVDGRYLVLGWNEVASVVSLFVCLGFMLFAAVMVVVAVLKAKKRQRAN